MTVLRIVPNLHTESVSDAEKFYREILDLDIVMDQGWVITYSSAASMHPQINIIASGSSQADPDISIEVDNLDEIYSRVKNSEFAVLYDLTLEPWGVRRFMVRDPLGKVINILQHE